MNEIIIVCGSPGAGKSTYARQLAKKMNAALIDIDTATERLVKLALSLSGHNSDDRDSPYFKAHFRAPIYEQMFDIAKENAVHTNVVLAGPFTKEMRDVSWPAALEKRVNAPVEIHYLFCDPDIRKERMRRRANPRDNGKFEAWKQVNAYYGAEAPPVFKHTFIDNSIDRKEDI
jgi:predicted kinase